jgi:hypothetical protein
MLCVLEKCLRLDETSQLNKQAYQYKLDRGAPRADEFDHEHGQNDLVGQRSELALYSSRPHPSNAFYKIGNHYL